MTGQLPRADKAPVTENYIGCTSRLRSYVSLESQVGAEISPTLSGRATATL